MQRPFAVSWIKIQPSFIETGRTAFRLHRPSEQWNQNERCADDNPKSRTLFVDAFSTGRDEPQHRFTRRDAL
jgi:hypothetical protein